MAKERQSRKFKIPRTKSIKVQRPEEKSLTAFNGCKDTSNKQKEMDLLTD